MNSAFEKCKKDHQEQIAVTEALQKAFKSIQPVTKGNIQTLVPKREFIPASQVKTFGKIEPSEQLEEPIGRQGRDVK
jgi:hypothetical protein